MRVKKILASVMAMATLAGTLVIPAAAAVPKCVNLTAKGTRLPFTWSVSYNDHKHMSTVCDHYVADRSRVKDHRVRVWNDQTGKRAESNKECGVTAKATVSCKPSTPNSKLTTIVEFYGGIHSGYQRAEGHAGKNVTTYFYL